MLEFDVVIVGAGSAGCVLADQLSRSGRDRVLVLEAGGGDRSPVVRVPIGYGMLFHDPKRNWMYEAEPDPGLMGRKEYWPRGKIVGGSSSINALVYCRGMPGDFDDWRDAGNPGWGWSDVEPVFRGIERNVVDDREASGAEPLWVRDISDQAHPLARHFFDAAREIGLPRTRDMNGPSPEGVGHYRVTTRRGLRCSAADAFLRPALGRQNLRLMTDTHATRIRFDGRRAVGVDFFRDGRARFAAARAGVIVAAGAVNSPQLLQLSGIGPGPLLMQLGIQPVLANDQVGGNLQDHLAVSFSYRSRESTLNEDIRTWRGRIAAAFDFALCRKGWLTLSVNQAGGFIRARPYATRPDFQLYFNPLTYTTEVSGRRRLIRPDPYPGFVLSFQPCRPMSRGRIDLKSPDAMQAPSIQPNSLSNSEDIDDVVEGGRLMRKFLATGALKRLIEASMGPDPAVMSDPDIVADYRARAGTVYHPVGTCRMGPKDSGVVDHRLRVHGIERLRVIDASVFPNITSGNTNAPTLMLASKAAGMILEDGGI